MTNCKHNKELDIVHLGGKGEVKQDELCLECPELDKDVAMGVSQWREYGKKRGYWQYFEEQFNKEKLEIESTAIVKVLKWVRFLFTYKHPDEINDECRMFIKRECDNFPHLKDIKRY